jgi:hypothetical protein
MAEDAAPVTIVASPPATVTTTTVRRRPFKVVLLNVLSIAGTVLLAVLGYLQTINLAGLVTPERAMLWIVGVNVLTIILRQFFSPPTVTETRVEQGPN